MTKTVRTAVLLTAATLGLSACANNRLDTKLDTQYVARDVNTLYALAKDRADRGQWKQAAALFLEVERQHPYSVWARRAQLMGAFAHYMSKDYIESVGAAQRFLTIHPGNKDAPYATYMVAMSYYQQIEDIERDQKITQQARDAFQTLVRRHPNTRYAADARLKLDLINDHLAGKEMEIGRFYQQQRNWLPATMRFRNVIDNYQTTSHAPEALHRLVESYLALGIPAEAQKAAAVLGANYPESKWYDRSYKLIQRYVPQG
ncbi:outer membrane protein assembly factor BamD [Sphingomicrobium lutaoense]